MKTLREYLSEQHHPPEMQDKLRQLYALPMDWLAINDSKAEHAYSRCAQDFATILGRFSP